jgi:hypothetical protein
LPNKAPTICRHHGCGRSCIGGYCQKHASEYERAREQRRRANGLRRLYDCAQWRRRTAPYIIARDPMCKIAILCGGNAPSTDVDHIVRAEIHIAQNGGDWAFFFDESNLQGACHACHARKTQIEQRRDHGGISS